MKQSDTHPQSLAARVLSLSLALLMLPLSARGYAQTIVTQSIPTGVPLTDSNSVITEVKPSEPIWSINTPRTNAHKDSVDKVLADVATFNAQISKLEVNCVDPKNPTREELLDLYSKLRFITPNEEEFITRIEGILTADSQKGSTIPSEQKETLQTYLKAFKEDKETNYKIISNIDEVLNKQAGQKNNASAQSTDSQVPKTPPWWNRLDPDKITKWAGAAAAVTAVLYQLKKLAEDKATNH